MESLQATLSALRDRVEADKIQRTKRFRVIKLVIVAAWLIGTFAGIAWLALTYGEGGNWFQKLKDVWAICTSLATLSVVIAEILVRYLLPEHDPLAKLLPSVFSKKG